MAEETSKVLSAIISGVSMACLFWAAVAVIDHTITSRRKK